MEPNNEDAQKKLRWVMEQRANNAVTVSLVIAFTFIFLTLITFNRLSH